MKIRCAMTLKFNDLPPDASDAEPAINNMLTDLGLLAAKRERRLFTPGELIGGLTTKIADDAQAESQMAASLRQDDAVSSLMLQGQLSKDQVDGLRDQGISLRGDVPIAAADLWTPYSPGGGIFGDRRRALDLIGADQTAKAEAGEGVNVIILDYGISHDWLRRYRPARGEKGGVAGGWARYGREGGEGKQWFNPGIPRAGTSDHAHMVARNILSIAPAATIWDVPLLPDTVLGPPGIAMAEAIFFHILRDLRDVLQDLRDGKQRRRGEIKPLPRGPWILVNAWGALDPAPYDAILPDCPYSDDPTHYFVEDMLKFSADGIDVVFAAGNCGSPGAHPLCGETSVGPGQSIHGVNAHPSVLTVGAVRVDGTPIGSSAQGPGMLSRKWTKQLNAVPVWQRDDPRAKPDICAPSHFRETVDGHLWNTGTSAACGMAAGMLALLRGIEVKEGRWKEGKSPRKPEEMRALLRQSAGGQAWDPQMGWGVANLAKARQALGLD